MSNIGTGFSGSLWCIAPKVPIIVGVTAPIAVKRFKRWRPSDVTDAFHLCDGE
jgi:hypothetical protein